MLDLPSMFWNYASASERPFADDSEAARPAYLCSIQTAMLTPFTRIYRGCFKFRYAFLQYRTYAAFSVPGGPSTSLCLTDAPWRAPRGSVYQGLLNHASASHPYGPP